jgi:hypothetical protein
VAESAGSVSAIVRLTTSTGQPTVDAVTVGYATSDSNAVAGGDYAAASGVITFAAGTRSGATFPITLTVIDDVAVEGDETFTIALVDARGAGLGGMRVTTVTIADDDGPPAESSIGERRSRGGEGVGAVVRP